jgi:hypothetical protein
MKNRKHKGKIRISYKISQNFLLNSIKYNQEIFLNNKTFKQLKNKCHNLNIHPHKYRVNL